MRRVINNAAQELVCRKPWREPVVVVLPMTTIYVTVDRSTSILSWRYRQISKMALTKAICFVSDRSGLWCVYGIEEKDYRDVSKVVLPLLHPSMFTVTPNCTCALFPLLVSFVSECTDFVSCFFLHHATAHTMTMMMMNYNYLSR